MFFPALTLQIGRFSFGLMLLLLFLLAHQVHLYISDVETKHMLSLNKTYCDGETRFMDLQNSSLNLVPETMQKHGYSPKR